MLTLCDDCFTRLNTGRKDKTNKQVSRAESWRYESSIYIKPPTAHQVCVNLLTIIPPLTTCSICRLHSVSRINRLSIHHPTYHLLHQGIKLSILTFFLALKIFGRGHDCLFLKTRVERLKFG